ncbi:MAG TPA: hypothetical protein VM865_10320 [Acidobacteriaceae bacterium]|jgi:hypothetical protein|nr:hypothetical protein [Acidobacteriaceae bacterium]
MSTRTFSVALFAAGLALGPSAFAQTSTAAPITTSTSANKTAGPANWSTEQLITSSVHDAWVLSGRNEATFFEMVTQLAQISADKRSLQLPESQQAGRRFGELVKTTAKADTDQLLYAVVDRAVKQVGVPLKSASTPTPGH